MIGDVTETLNQLSIRSFFERVKLRQVPATISHIQKNDMSIISLQVASFCCPVFQKFANSKQRENEKKIPAKKRPFLTVYTR